MLPARLPSRLLAGGKKAGALGNEVSKPINNIGEYRNIDFENGFWNRKHPLQLPLQA
jgi:hypothetical protein